ATSSPVVFKGECYFSRRKEVTLAQAGKGIQQNEALGGTTNNALLSSNYALAGGLTSSGRPTTTAGPVTNYNVDRLETKELAATERPADYLDAKKRQAGSRIEQANQVNDAAVGFAGMADGSKGSFKFKDAENVGQGTVAGVWAYQGSKPFVWQDRLY